MSAIEDLRELCNILENKNNGGNCASTPSPQSPSYSNEVAPKSPNEVRPGAYTQYTAFGPGFMPVSDTIKTLKPAIYRIESSMQGAYFVPMNVVTDNLLRLPDSKSDQVISEIERFWTLKDTFAKYGYAHKRGFLLWGPQGSGKTSTVNVVMQETVKNGGTVFNVGDVAPGLTAIMLGQFREVEPERRAVVIIEDIDALIARWGEQEVLALLDGEKSIANVVYIATTNYPERLEPRVVNRPSRFDQVVKIGMPNADARRVYIESRNLDLSDDEMTEWVEVTEGFSIAHIKETIISVKCYGVDLYDTVERLRAMAKLPKSDSPEKPVGFNSNDKKAATGFGRG